MGPSRRRLTSVALDHVLSLLPSECPLDHAHMTSCHQIGGLETGFVKYSMREAVWPDPCECRRVIRTVQRKKETKNIQHQGFAGRHRPNY